MPAGPRTAGRPRTRHLARKLGILDAQNTWGAHTPPPSPLFACIILLPRSSGLGGLGGRSFAPFGVCCTNARHGIISRPASDLAIAMGCPGQPGFAGVVSRVAELQLFCRRAAFWPKCGRPRVSAFRRRAGGPLHQPTRGRPHPGNGLPRAARICGGRLPRCRATAVLPPSVILAKMRLRALFGVSSPHGRPGA